MKITVATVCFNAEATIARTIESVASQTHTNVEHLIIDGASSDDTVAIAQRYASHHPHITITSEPDRGMYDALNKALKRYTGDAFGVLNADDRYADPTSLARIAEGLEGADVVYGHLDFVNGEGAVTRRWRVGPRPKSGFRGGWMPAHPTFYVHRHVADQVGPFDLSYPTASDYHYMMRAFHGPGDHTDHGHQVGHNGHNGQGDPAPRPVRDCFIPHVLITMQEGGRSTASLQAHLRHNWEAAKARRAALGTGFLDPALILKPARKVGQFMVRTGR